MSKPQKPFHWPVLLIGLLAVGAIAFASARRARDHTEGKSLATATRKGTAPANTDRARYVRRRGLWPQLQKNFEVLGDRLEKPGKERTLLTGTVRRAGDAAETPVEVFREFPDRLRFSEVGMSRRSTVFNGRADRGPSFTSSELDIIETLLFDSVDYFFAARMEGVATSFLGSGFRLDDGRSRNYTGPLYDIFVVTEQIKTGRAVVPRAASYYFNSRTHFLERVRYQRERNGSLINVEVVMGDWRDVGGQRIAMNVERFENGRSVLSFAFVTAAFGPA